MLRRVRYGWVYLTTWGPFAVITICCGSLGVIAAVLRVKSIAKRCLYWWAKASCWSLGLKPDMMIAEGATWPSSLNELGQGVMIANHMSHLDILMIASLAPFDMRILAKSSLFKVPFLGWYIRACGHIPVFRGERRHLNKTIGRTAIQSAIDAGATLFIFPEGTRSKDGQLKPFRSGAFVIAAQHDLTLYPILVRGTSQLLRAGGRVIHKDPNVPCTLTFLPEFSSSSLCEGQARVGDEELSEEEKVKRIKAHAEGLYQEAFTQS